MKISESKVTKVEITEDELQTALYIFNKDCIEDTFDANIVREEIIKLVMSKKLYPPTLNDLMFESGICCMVSGDPIRSFRENPCMVPEMMEILDKCYDHKDNSVVVHIKMKNGDVQKFTEIDFDF